MDDMAKKKMAGMHKATFMVGRSVWRELEVAAGIRFTTRSQILRDLISSQLCRFAEEEKLKRLMAKGA